MNPLQLGTAVVSLTLVCGAATPAEPTHIVATLPSNVTAVLLVGTESLAVTTASTPIEVLARAELSLMAGVDGAYVQEPPEDEEGVTINVLAREHGIVDRESLFKIEDLLEKIFEMPVRLVVLAHQGRDMRSMAGPNLLFARG